MGETADSIEASRRFFGQLGPALRIVRERAGLSGAVLARAARIGKSQLSKYETGRELPRMETLSRLLDVLDIAPLRFFYLMHRLDRDERGELYETSLQLDLVMLDDGPAAEVWEAAGFRKIIESVLDLHRLAVEQGGGTKGG